MGKSRKDNARPAPSRDSATRSGRPFAVSPLPLTEAIATASSSTGIDACRRAFLSLPGFALNATSTESLPTADISSLTSMSGPSQYAAQSGTQPLVPNSVNPPPPISFSGIVSSHQSVKSASLVPPTANMDEVSNHLTNLLEDMNVIPSIPRSDIQQTESETDFNPLSLMMQTAKNNDCGTSTVASLKRSENLDVDECLENQSEANLVVSHRRSSTVRPIASEALPAFQETSVVLPNSNMPIPSFEESNIHSCPAERNFECNNVDLIPENPHKALKDVYSSGNGNTAQGTFPITNTVTNNLAPSWSSLFKKLPSNAGDFVPRDFDMVQDGNIFIPPVEVIQAGTDYWNDYLVGFFLDSSPSYSTVKEHCTRVWRIRGGLHVHMDRSMYFFKFSRPDERLRILSSDPSFICGKPFIVTSWSPSVDNARDQVLSIPVWTYFSHIPSVLQPLLGLNWLANSIGKLKCFDANTVARKKIVYAKALIEISPTKPLPDLIKVRLPDGSVAEIVVRYGWKPDICSSCKSFGHTIDRCSRLSTVSTIPLSDRFPLPTPPVLKWVPKVSSVSQELPAAAVEIIPDFATVSDTVEVDSDVTIGSPSRLDSSALARSCDVDIALGPATLSPPVTDSAVVTDITVRPSIIWDTQESAWIHLDSAIRYRPRDDLFYSFVTDDDLDRRVLYYSISGDSLALAVEGQLAIRNKEILADVTWDRSFIFSPASKGYEQAIALQFRPFAHITGDSPSDKGG